MTTSSQAPRALLAMLAASSVWLVAWCAPALAHAQLSGSEPAAGENVAESPEQVRLRFSEPVEAVFSPVKVYGPSGERVDRDDARVDPADARTIEAGLEELPEGTYKVEYRVTSVDGHIVEDAYDFTVAASGGAGEAEAGDAGEAETGEPEAGSDSLFHYLHYAVLGIGAVALLAIALRGR